MSRQKQEARRQAERAPFDLGRASRLTRMLCLCCYWDVWWTWSGPGGGEAGPVSPSEAVAETGDPRP